MNLLTTGAIVLACAVIGLHFLRFWKTSRDSFFLYFAAAFWIQGGQWLYTGVVSTSEYEAGPYLVRLLAYLLIVVAILRKNFPGRRAV